MIEAIHKAIQISREWLKFKEAWRDRRLTRSTETRVARWIKALEGHGLSACDGLSLLGKTDVTLAETASHDEIATLLTPELIEGTSCLLNVRPEWLAGRDLIYDPMTLDRSLQPLVQELVDWSREGEDHALLVFKSGRAALDEEPYQHGALVLRRKIACTAQFPIHVYRPVHSLQWWGEPVQRVLALRCMWTAWQMSIDVRGYRATERQCQRLADGKLFPGLVLPAEDWKSWHPDDYVVRPSARARGEGWIENIIARHDDELTTLLRAANHDCRQIRRRDAVNLRG